MKRRLKTIGTTALVAAALLTLGIGAQTGSASSGTLTITENTTFAEDHAGNVLITAEGVTLDCAGHAITRATGGFRLVGVNVLADGVTVRNCRVTGFDTGILATGDATRIVANTVTGNGQGIRLAEATDGLVLGNRANGNADWGIILAQRSSGNVVTGNSANGNGNIGIAVNDSFDNLIAGNVTNGNGNDGFNSYLSWLNVFAHNGAAKNGRIGFEFSNADGNVVVGNRAAGNGTQANGVGFNFNESSGNRVAHNIARKNGTNGFFVFFGSEGNLFTGNCAGRNLGLDAFDTSTGSGNSWIGNSFGTTSGI